MSKIWYDFIVSTSFDEVKKILKKYSFDYGESVVITENLFMIGPFHQIDAKTLMEIFKLNHIVADYKVAILNRSQYEVSLVYKEEYE